MKRLVPTIVSVFALCATAGAEEYLKGRPTDSASETVVMQEAGGDGAKDIDAGSGARSPRDGGVDDAGAMPSFQEYDDTTGMPNRVPSDSYGEIDE